MIKESDYKEKYEEAKDIVVMEKGRDPHGWRSS